MAGIFSNAFRRMRITMEGFTPGQKSVTVLGVMALVLGGYFFSIWASKSPYTPLFSNLVATDANSITQQLSTAGVPYQLADGGATIMVPQDKVYATRLTLSGLGLPAGSKDGYALLDKQGITTSDFMQHVDYQRALEGELARTISSIDGVQSAVVHLALPQQTVFADATNKPTASVLVSMRPGVKLSASQTQAVVNLVAASVPALAPEAVSVADGSGHVLSGGPGGSDPAGSAREEQTNAFQDQLATSVQEMLNQVVGAGRAVVRIKADLDFDQLSTTTKTYTYDPNVPPLVNTTTSEKYTGSGGTPVGGVLGSTPGTAAAGTNGNNLYDKTSQTVNNSVGSITEERKGAPGAVKRLTVAVLLDSQAAGTLNTTQVSQLVSNAVGLDTTRGDSIQVGAMPFDKTTAAATQKALVAAQSAASRASLFTMIRKGALALLVLAILVLAFLSSRRTKRIELSPAELAELEEARRLLAMGTGDQVALAIGGAAQSSPDMIPGRTPDPLAARRLAAREDISEMVEQQPDEVAQVLRGWLTERRR